MIIEAVINLAITIAAAYLCCYIVFAKVICHRVVMIGVIKG